MTAPSETFDLPPELRARANEITGKYRMALAMQMAEEMVDAGVPMNLAFQITVGELAVSAARVAMMACVGLEKREPRRDLWMKRAQENFDEAREWFANLQAEGRISNPTTDEYIHADILHGEGVAHPLGVLASIPAPPPQMDVPNFGHFIEKSREVLTSIGKTITATPHQTNSEGKEPPLDWGNFEGPKRNVEWKPDDQDLIYTALNFRDDGYGDQDEDAGQQIVERLLAAWRSSVISEQLTFEISARLLTERDEARAALAATPVAELCKRTFAVQHNPNCPAPWLVRLPGKGPIDMKPYGDPLRLVAHQTGDVLGFGKTFDEAARAALATASEGSADA